MRKHGMPAAHASHPNVTPLIDVVMCLIIFFMLVAKIGVDTGADRAITIPATIRGQEIKDMGNTLTLNVQPGPLDQPYVTALVKDEIRELKIVDPTNNVAQLMVELQHHRQANPEFKVIIRAPEEMDYRFLEPVLFACAEAKVKNVNFNTRKG
jgi:biopolymer transport protein ExbD